MRETYSENPLKNNNKYVVKFEKACQNLWGFKVFSVSILNESTINAYTFPAAYNINMNPGEWIETTSTGYRFKKEARMSSQTILTRGILTNPAFTNEESFAIVLHEIGHSFVHRSPKITAMHDVFKKSMVTGIFMQIILGILLLNPLLVKQGFDAFIKTNNITNMVRLEFDKVKKKIPILRNVKSAFQYLGSKIVDPITAWLVDINSERNLQQMEDAAEYYKTKKGKKRIKQTRDNHAYDRSVERLSDDFANMYGFGSALATGLLKMENMDNHNKDMKDIYNGMHEDALNKIYAINMELDGAMNAHPGSVDRILAMLDGIKKDYSSDKHMSDELKKECKAQVDELQKVIEGIKKNEGVVKKNKNKYMKILYKMQIENGNSESDLEKSYTDRIKLNNAFYDKMVDESTILTAYDILGIVTE
jgi:Zn-dependent protease with chaperone function